MDIKRNFDKNKILIGWLASLDNLVSNGVKLGIDKINSADPPVGRQVELAEGNCHAGSVAGSKGSSARMIKLSEPAIEMLFL